MVSAILLLGLLLGSFAGATVWRLRAFQLADDKREGDEYDKHEYKSLHGLTQRSVSEDRSECLSCHHTLAWYDLIPLLSWISTGGKCRYCHEPIGYFEPIMELSTALLCVLFYLNWQVSETFAVNLIGLITGFVIITMMMILLAYDAKWYLLPDKVMFPLIGISAVVSGYMIITDDAPMEKLVSTIGAVLLLGGIYLALWIISRMQWVGFGDVKLGLALGLLLADWQLAFLTLFLANLIGLLVALPGLLSGKLSRKAHIPFGPMLIIGFFISYGYGMEIIDWYMVATNKLVLEMLML